MAKVILPDSWEERRSAVMRGLTAVLSTHRGRVATVRPKHVARALGLPVTPLVLNQIAAVMRGWSVVRVDGRSWRLVAEVRDKPKAKCVTFIYAR